MTTTPINIAISGAAGRMGIALIKALQGHADLNLAACGVRAGTESQAIAQFEAANISYAANFMVSHPSQLYANADAVIDFSAPEHAVSFVGYDNANGKVLVCGTTGLSATQKEALTKAGERMRIVLSSNMSIGVNLMIALLEHAAAKLSPEEFDVEILEMHHRHKVDAPSGTALSLGAAIARGRDIQLSEHWVKSRDGHTGARKAGQVGFSALRGGDVIGDHTVMFAGSGERIEITHRASNRDIFAKGALKAAAWAAHQPNGFYTMRDVVKI
jgi:4-hydroxy-tetrahydrodipicolinate reductase